VRGTVWEGEEGTDEKRDRDRSVTPLDLVGLTFECFVDSTASAEKRVNRRVRERERERERE